MEKYDIFTINDSEEYAILDKIIIESNEYLVISEVNEEDEPNIEKIKYVKYENDTINEIENDIIKAKIAKIFIENLKK